MIFELKEKHFGKIMPIIKKLQYRPSLICIVNRNNTGRIFVDDANNPKTALVWTRWGFNYLVGHHTNNRFNKAIRKHILENLIPEGIKLKQETGFILYIHPENFCTIIEELFVEKLPLKDHRNIFTFNSEKFKKHLGWRKKIPEGFEIKRIDKTLAKRLSDTIGWNWDSVDNFLSKGFGFSLLTGQKIVSSCYSIFVGKNTYEIEINTHPTYRGRGFATLVASAFIDHCLSNGLTPHWECWKGHTTSNRLAGELGFELREQCIAYSIEFTEFDTYIDHAYYYFRDKQQFTKSAEFFVKAFEIKEGRAEDYYTAACVWARTGNKEDAVKYLNSAIDKGWTDADHMRKNENLKILHETKEWRELLLRLKGKVEKHK